jgi:diacylglycerol kinase family enzyme
VPPEGIIFLNPRSGPGEIDAETLKELFPGVPVELCAPDDLAASVDKAVADRVGFIGAAGGDGTIRSAVARMVDTDVELLVIPAGTRNHFAKDLGITSFEDAATAWREGRSRRVDVGSVNGACFVNNSSIGVYPMMVVHREEELSRLPKRLANVMAAWRQLRSGHRLALTLDGMALKAWMLFVGNGRYGSGLFDLTDREALDAGLLDVRVIRADRPLARLRIAGSLASGRLDHSDLIVDHPGAEVEIGSDRPEIEVALDGEVHTLKTPLCYAVRRLALSVLVGPED